MFARGFEPFTVRRLRLMGTVGQLTKTIGRSHTSNVANKKKNSSKILPAPNTLTIRTWPLLATVPPSVYETVYRAQ